MIMNQGQFPTYKNLYPVQITPTTSIRLHGFEPDRDIPIEFIGLRPGEKLYEELITVGEGIMPTSHQKIKVIQGNHGDFQILSAAIEELISVADTFDGDAIKNRLHAIVPEYMPQ